MARPPRFGGPSCKQPVGTDKPVAEKKRRPRKVRLRPPGTPSDEPAEAASPITQEVASNPIYPTPLLLGQADPRVLRPILIPFPEPKEGAGRRFLRPLVKRLEVAAATHVLRAYDALMAREDTTSAKALEIVEAVTPRTIDFMQRIGRKNLKESMLTTDAIDNLACILRPTDTGVADTHLSMARLLSIALARAHRLIDGADAALKEKDPIKAELIFQRAFYLEPSNISRIDVVCITASANINAAVLWPQFIDDMPFLEVSRFAARLLLDAHRPYDKRHAKLLRSLFPEARLALGDVSERTPHPDVLGALRLIRALLEAGRFRAKLLDAIDCADIAGIDLVIGGGEDPMKSRQMPIDN